MQAKILFTALVVMAFPTTALAAPPEEVTEYAQRTGKTQQEASRCLDLQEKADSLTFKYGFWLEDGPCRFKVPVPTTATTYTTAAKKAIGKAKLLMDTDFIRTRDLQTWTQLEAQQAQLNADPEVSQAMAAGTVQTWIDPKSNRPMLTQKPPLSAGGETMQPVAEDYGAGFEIGNAAEFPAHTASDCQFPNCNPMLRGGVRVQTTGQNCSAGPMGRLNGNQYPPDWVMFTAGHCVSYPATVDAFGLYGGRHEIGWVFAFRFDMGGDYAAIKVSQSSWWNQLRPRGYINWNGPTTFSPTKGAANSYVGLNVCTSGAGHSGPRSCGIVTQLNTTMQYAGEPGRTGHLTKATGLCIYGGDSGAPVWSNNTYKGIVSGGFCGTTWYTEINRAAAGSNSWIPGG